MHGYHTKAKLAYNPKIIEHPNSHAIEGVTNTGYWVHPKLPMHKIQNPKSQICCITCINDPNLIQSYHIKAPKITCCHTSAVASAALVTLVLQVSLKFHYEGSSLLDKFVKINAMYSLLKSTKITKNLRKIKEK